MRLLQWFILILVSAGLHGQPNCQYYLSLGDSCQYKACKIATAPIGYQGSKISQIKLDEAIKVCPSFGYAYKVKSIPFLKRGYWIEWKRLIDLAVKYDEVGQLGYRGWCRYQFLRDYKGALRDFERLGELQSDLGYSANGTYHLEVAKAICQDALGDTGQGLITINTLLAKPNYYVGPFDYLHQGMLLIKLEKYQEAIIALSLQLEQDINADTHYYLALAYHKVGNNSSAKIELEKAYVQYDLSNYRSDPYGETEGRIYKEDIEELRLLIAK